ncbi:DUF982 domain-containing protein [Tianweitania sp. BSSL-BM11]|uniref:DUF982 domain-containing protein n=1 Tax=Tianweitania aestuarii TaxID=2814886 RepID=A0ABS5RYL8_9HYPH|nr:DUF982 domain-containing protein [Tianweitania aestuarii]MBS9722113.1 DUF982 domain-containing protein [Tianweitania aestuarii]
MITTDAFYIPVPLPMGPDAKRDIRTLSEMHEFLSGWPCVRISPSYEAARRTCSAARAGRLSVEQARRALLTFSQSADFLGSKQPLALHAGK